MAHDSVVSIVWKPRKGTNPPSKSDEIEQNVKWTITKNINRTGKQSHRNANSFSGRIDRTVPEIACCRKALKGLHPLLLQGSSQRQDLWLSEFSCSVARFNAPPPPPSPWIMLLFQIVVHHWKQATVHSMLRRYFHSRRPKFEALFLRSSVTVQTEILKITCLVSAYTSIL
jgi:hypothetical protein